MSEPNVNAKQILDIALPEALRAQSYVAGSAATPLNRTYRDIDVWVLEPTLPRTRHYITDQEQWAELNEQREKHPTVQAILTWCGYREPSDPFIYQIEENTHLKRVCKKQIITDEGVKLVQIMCVSEERIEDLLDKFDISTHEWAISYENVVHQGPRATLTSDPPRVTRFTTPHSTLRRYFDVCQRYKQPVYWEDVNHLARIIAGVPEHVA